MASRSSLGRWGKSGDPNLRGSSAAQKLAVESLSNIANVTVHDVNAAVHDTGEITAIVGVLRGAGGPLAVAEVAERLQWNSEKTASALARGGVAGDTQIFEGRR